MSRPLALVALLLITLSWSAALTAAPRHAAPRVSALTYASGALICHQRSERSFHYEGAQYPVCARCFGLYVGAVGGVLVWAGMAGLGRTPRTRAMRITRPNVARLALIISALPTLVTVVTSWLGWWDGGNVVRAVLAFPLGATITAVLSAVATGDLR